MMRVITERWDDGKWREVGEHEESSCRKAKKAIRNHKDVAIQAEINDPRLRIRKVK